MSIRYLRSTLPALLCLAVSFSLAGCQKAPQSEKLIIDGSSTVEPITAKMVEEFTKQEKYKNAKVLVNKSGTGGGFKKWLKKETMINDASRPIKEGEVKEAEEAGIEFSELKIAYDGITVVVNPKNDWAKELTVEQLKEMWSSEGKARKWSDLNSEWPDKEIVLHGPDDQSGTYDYFREEVLGKEGTFRPDFSSNTDDNALVKGVAEDEYALGYFGYSYYVDNKNKLTAVAIKEDADSDAVLPTQETIKDGSYTPLSRPLFLYVNNDGLKNKTVADFLTFYLGEGQKFVADAGFVPLDAEELKASQKKLEDALPGK